MVLELFSFQIICLFQYFVLHNLKIMIMFVGTTDSSISEEDPTPPPLPAKHRDTEYSNLSSLSSNENYSFLYSNRNSSLRSSMKILINEALELSFDDSDVPPTPPPKPPKVKNQDTVS